jgi:hypothetical protein
MSMAHGLEIRAPYLDPAVLAVSMALGSNTILARNKPSKWLLRDGWGPFLDPATLRRRKTGFTLDSRSGLLSERVFVDDVVHDLARRKWLDGKRVLSLAHALRESGGHVATWARLMMLVQLELHVRRWGDP